MKKWELQNNSKFDLNNFDKEKFISILLENRGIKSKKEIEEFLNPKLESITSENLGISKKDLVKAGNRLKKAKKNNDQIIIFGDYDADGITATALLWENFNKSGFIVMPYIPNRIDEGYGLSIKAIDNLLKKYPDTRLIITVDNGIVANEPVDYAKKLGIDVVITDHHVPSGSLPNALAIIHSTKVCGCSVAYIFADYLFDISKSNLDLVAIATVTDVMKLVSYNRILLINGIKELRRTKRIGVQKLLDVVGIDKEKIGVYEIGNVIGPRINAMGRIENGMDSLRLLCTPNKKRAGDLAQILNDINIKRQQMTFDSTDHARGISNKNKKIIVIADESYNQGVVGLIAGRITEEFYRPAIVIAKEKGISKGSARSVKGVNIIELLRKEKGLFVSLGGHPGAAGFSIETKKIPELRKRLEKLAEKEIRDELLIKKVRIDVKLPIDLLNLNLYKEIYTLSPFGFGNPEPVFQANNLIIENLRYVGKESKHLKLSLIDVKTKTKIQGILFVVDRNLKLKINDKTNVAYSISLNEWNGNKSLELKIKDIVKI